MKEIFAEDFVEFQKRWPDAEAFLLHAHLKFELHCLENWGEHVTEWQKGRRSQLRKLKEDTLKIGGEW